MKTLMIEIDCEEATCGKCEELKWETSGAPGYKIPKCKYWGGLVSTVPDRWIPQRHPACLEAERKE